MSDTLFKAVHYPLGTLINDIGLGRIGLPDIQRTFVWANAKVRDLFDSVRVADELGLNALDWWGMAYPEFLAARRPLIAGVVQAGYLKLVAVAV